MGSTCEMESLISPDFAIISEDCWVMGEEAIEEIVNLIHPTLDSEEKRNDVIDFVQRLIKISLGCEVFSYGSVPLKTYLPDGDIDLTVFSSPIIEETLARDVLALLQEEELKENTEYDVKDPQFIDAEVKLVKCLVQNTVVDISFNQLGGLCTLCFLEQVDRLVGKNHLFKRSIILIKAWCYYESRILGAHHGLISTYALETLVLFIFHQFHSSLNSPLAVLYRFLDYCSKFDWDNYCISLNGPICKSSLPGLLGEIPEFVSDNLLLSEEFLRNCTEMFSVPSRGPEINTRVFQQKHLNIIDPLRENNNLGRSVNRANSYRIQRAFKYGARKLSNILLLPSDKIADEINKFFSNTIESHRHNHLADFQDSCPIFGDEDTCSSLSLVEFYADDRMLLKSSDGDFENDSLKKVFKSISSELLGKINGVSSDAVSENGSLSDDRAVSGFCLYRDTYDPSASVPPKINLDGANGTYDCCFNGNSVSSLSRKHYHAPSFHFNNSSIKNGNCGPENLCQSDLSDSGLRVDTRECSLESSSIYQSGTEYSEGVLSGGSAISSPKTSILESLSLDIGERDSASTAGDIEAMSPLADLSGDYDSHIRSLLYGQSCCGSALSALVLNSPSSPSQFQNKSFWDTVRQSMPLKQNSFRQTNVNTELVGPTVHHYSNSLPATATLGSEEKETAKGTGTYFLNSMRCCKGRTRNKAPGNHGQLHSHSGTHSNGWFPAFSDANRSEKCTEEISGRQSSVQGRGTFAVPSQSDELLTDSHANGFSNSSGRIEFGSLGNLPEDELSCTSRDVLLIPSVPEKVQFSKPVCGKQERAAEHPLRLKNEDDFPPLSMGKV